MKSILALLALAVVQASFWDSYDCDDNIVSMPSNATDTIIFFVGENVADDYNKFEYNYDWFESEMGEGTPVQGETYTMYNGDINNYCGAIIYSFNVFNLAGEDVTAEYVPSIFKYESITWEDDTTNDSQQWRVTVDQTALTELEDGDMFVWALTALYFDGTSAGELYTTTTPFAAMAKIELFDASPFTAVVDGYLDMLDPILQTHFFDGLVVSAIIFGGVLPGVMTAGQLAMAVFLPPAYWGMIVFNGPITAVLGGYWWIIYNQGKAKYCAMIDPTFCDPDAVVEDEAVVEE